MSDKKLSWNDITQGNFRDLQRVYKINDRQLENAVRRHMDGANPKERRELYETVWNRKK